MNKTARNAPRYRPWLRAMIVLVPTLLILLGILVVSRGMQAAQDSASAPQNAAGPAASARPDQPAAGEVLVINTLVARSEPSIEELRTYTGLVKARRSGDLGFPRGGRVLRLLVSEGDVVEADQPIAELEQRRLEARQTSIDDALERARTALEALDPEAPALTVEGMQTTVQELRTELDQLAGELAAAARTAPGQPNQSFADRLVRAERKLATLNESSRRQQIEAQKKQVAELEAQQEDANLELEEGTLLAPYSGIIALRHVSEGTVVSAGMPIVRLVEQAALQVWVGIPVEIASQVETGQRISLTVAKQTLSGTVLARLPQLDRTTRTRTVILQLDSDAATRVLPGEIARVQLRTTNSTAGVWLPLSALSREARGLWSVFVVTGDAGQQTISRRYVELLRSEADRALVRGTLDDGENVVASGMHRVVPGQRVRARDVSSAYASGKRVGASR